MYNCTFCNSHAPHPLSPQTQLRALNQGAAEARLLASFRCVALSPAEFPVKTHFSHPKEKKEENVGATGQDDAHSAKKMGRPFHSIKVDTVASRMTYSLLSPLFFNFPCLLISFPFLAFLILGSLRSLHHSYSLNNISMVCLLLLTNVKYRITWIKR